MAALLWCVAAGVVEDVQLALPGTDPPAARTGLSHFRSLLHGQVRTETDAGWLLRCGAWRLAWCYFLRVVRCLARCLARWRAEMVMSSAWDGDSFVDGGGGC